jgi:glycosyltransferase involved in cell wall biosynthesis
MFSSRAALGPRLRNRAWRTAYLTDGRDSGRHSHIMMSQPAVSILVTVYNREAYLAACLESILASTWDDFEVVVVDDGSTDGSVAIATEYASRDPRVRFFQNDSNLGDYPNRMRAAELARGRYIKYVDSDDLIYCHSLAIMMEAMEAHPAAGFGLSHSSPEDDQPYPWMLSPPDAWKKEFLGSGCLSCGPSGAIIRRDAFFEAKGFRDWGVLSDIDLWYRMSARFPVVLLPPGLVWWRRHGAQEFARDEADMFYLEKGHALAVDALTSAACPLSEAERHAALARARQHHARRLMSLALRRRRPLRALQLLRRSGLSASELLQGLRAYR